MGNLELQEKAIRAAARFIELKGFELLKTGRRPRFGVKFTLSTQVFICRVHVLGSGARKASLVLLYVN